MQVEQSTKTDVIQRIQDQKDWKNLIINIAGLKQSDLETFHNNHFSSLPQEVQEGIMKIEQTLWAISKVLEKLWPIFKQHIK